MTRVEIESQPQADDDKSSSSAQVISPACPNGEPSVTVARQDFVTTLLKHVTLVKLHDCNYTGRPTLLPKALNK